MGVEGRAVEANGRGIEWRVWDAGIAVSNDKVLQTRVLAYADTQRYRLGVNYQLLYINAPRCPFHNNHQDGLMNVTERNEEVRPLVHQLGDPRGPTSIALHSFISVVASFWPGVLSPRGLSRMVMVMDP